MSNYDNLLNNQKEYWDIKFTNKKDMFGKLPSVAAIKAVDAFKENKCTNLIELGAGQGRDTLFFLEKKFKITALDYSQSGINQIIKKSQLSNNYNNLTAKCHDLRLTLPFDDNYFDGCFSHMLYCMAFTLKQLKLLSDELLRILKPGALNIFTVRNHNDGDYKNGKFIDKNLYQNDGFIVHFFSLDIINKLSEGFETLSIDDFEEGAFPRKLYLVIMKKK